MNDHFHLEIGQSIRSGEDIWYKNVQKLGHGGNAVTYLALATSGTAKGVLFAIKVFRRISKPQRKVAFLEEIAFLRSVDHPSIMRVYDAGIFRISTANGEIEFPFVAAEYLPHTLSEVMRTGDITIAEKVSYALQLLSALSYLASHDPPVIHRDIKPPNIFVKGGSCVLGDFGLMKFLNRDDELDRNTLKESELPGMPLSYRTPDLVAYARREAGISTATDVFQLGLVLTELFTGVNPANRPNDALDDFEMGQVGAVPGELGAGVATLLRRMLVLDPNDREPAAGLMDAWSGVFSDIVRRGHALEGRVF